MLHHFVLFYFSVALGCFLGGLTGNFKDFIFEYRHLPRFDHNKKAVARKVANIIFMCIGTALLWPVFFAVVLCVKHD